MFDNLGWESTDDLQWPVEHPREPTKTRDATDNSGLELPINHLLSYKSKRRPSRLSQVTNADDVEDKLQRRDSMLGRMMGRARTLTRSLSRKSRRDAKGKGVDRGSADMTPIKSDSSSGNNGKPSHESPSTSSLNLNQRSVSPTGSSTLSLPQGVLPHRISRPPMSPSLTRIGSNPILESAIEVPEEGEREELSAAWETGRYPGVRLYDGPVPDQFPSDPLRTPLPASLRPSVDSLPDLPDPPLLAVTPPSPSLEEDGHFGHLQEAVDDAVDPLVLPSLIGDSALIKDEPEVDSSAPNEEEPTFFHHTEDPSIVTSSDVATFSPDAPSSSVSSEAQMPALPEPELAAGLPAGPALSLPAAEDAPAEDAPAMTRSGDGEELMEPSHPSTLPVAELSHLASSPDSDPVPVAADNSAIEEDGRIPITLDPALDHDAITSSVTVLPSPGAEDPTAVTGSSDDKQHMDPVAVPLVAELSPLASLPDSDPAEVATDTVRSEEDGRIPATLEPNLDRDPNTSLETLQQPASPSPVAEDPHATTSSGNGEQPIASIPVAEVSPLASSPLASSPLASSPLASSPLASSPDSDSVQAATESFEIEEEGRIPATANLTLDQDATTPSATLQQPAPPQPLLLLDDSLAPSQSNSDPGQPTDLGPDLSSLSISTHNSALVDSSITFLPTSPNTDTDPCKRPDSGYGSGASSPTFRPYLAYPGPSTAVPSDHTVEGSSQGHEGSTAGIEDVPQELVETETNQRSEEQQENVVAADDVHEVTRAELSHEGMRVGQSAIEIKAEEAATETRAGEPTTDAKAATVGGADDSAAVAGPDESAAVAAAAESATEAIHEGDDFQLGGGEVILPHARFLFYPPPGQAIA